LKFLFNFKSIFFACALLLAVAAHANETGLDELGAQISNAVVSESNNNPSGDGSTDATVSIFHEDIVTFRAPLLGISPQERAKRAEYLIHQSLNTYSQHRVSTVENPLGSIVKIDNETVFIVTKDDLDVLTQDSLQTTVKESLSVLNDVVQKNARSRNVEFMSRAFAKAGFATLIALILVWLITRCRSLLENWFLRFTQKHAEKIRLNGAGEYLQKPLILLIKHVVLLLYWFAILIICYEWLSLVLAQFPQTQTWGEQLNQHLFDLAARFGNAIMLSIPDLFTAFIIFMLAKVVIQGLESFFDVVEAGSIKLRGFEPDVAGTTRRIVSVVIWLFAFAMAYPYLPGSETAAFKGISVLVGLMMSFGASSLVSQAGSGLILTYTRIFRRGEYISIGEYEGTVVELGLFTTRIRTGAGVELAIPNSYILDNVTNNHSRAVQGAGFVVEITVGVGYDTPWRQVHALMIEAAKKTEGVLSVPEPQVFQLELADFYPKYRLICQVIPSSEQRPRAEMMSLLHANIQDIFNEYGVQLMSPQYYEDPPQPKIVPTDQWYKAPAKPPT
jgi:small-conductance mechanosensitive channel